MCGYFVIHCAAISNNALVQLCVIQLTITLLSTAAPSVHILLYLAVPIGSESVALALIRVYKSEIKTLLILFHTPVLNSNCSAQFNEKALDFTGKSQMNGDYHFLISKESAQTEA